MVGLLATAPYGMSTIYVENVPESTAKALPKCTFKGVVPHGVSRFHVEILPESTAKALPNCTLLGVGGRTSWDVDEFTYNCTRFYGKSTPIVEPSTKLYVEQQRWVLGDTHDGSGSVGHAACL